jgi:hypothetical protein
MNYSYLAIFIAYILLAYVSCLELRLYKLSEQQQVKYKFIYKPYKILIYFSLGLIYLLMFLKN